MLILTADQAKDICWEDTDEFKIVEDGDWVDDGKYSHREVIFSKENKFYSLSVSRSGSYYTDYYYDWEDTDKFECPEVEAVEKTVTVWKAKK